MSGREARGPGGGQPIPTGPKVSITIVNHRARDLLRTCLRSLRDHPYTLGETEVVVIDNASEDGSVEMVRDEFPEVTLLPERHRRGFGANQNRAIAASSGDLVFMLNPDAVVHADTIDLLVHALAGKAQIGAAGGPTANDDGSLRQSRPHPFPGPWSAFSKAIGMRRLNFQKSTWEVGTHGWPSGGACLVKREVFDEVGGFDEDYFMYSEDTDLFARMVRRGYSMAWAPDALVTHPHPVEADSMTARRETEKVNAELRYMRSHFGERPAMVYQAGVMLDAALRIALWSLVGIRRKVGAKRLRQRARLGAAARSGRGPRLADLASDWNQIHGVTPDSETKRGRASGPGLIVFDTGASWDGPWMAFQHIAGYLAKRAPVLFIDAAESPSHARRNGRRWSFRSPLVELDDNLYRLTPSAPPGLTRRPIRPITSFVVRRTVRSAIRHLDTEVHAVLSNYSLVNLFDVAPARVRVYYVSDDFQAGAGLMGRPVKDMAIRDEEGAALADSIVVISEQIAEAFRRRGYDPVLVPNGVAAEVFADVDSYPRPTDVNLEGPIAGYIGHIGDRIDIELLEAVADTGISLLLIGPRQATFRQDARLTQLLARPNTQWLGPRSFSDLPPYLGLMDVGLVPYTGSDFNRASFPLKTLEYLAAGRPVVSTPLPAIRWLDTDLVITEAEPEAFGLAAATAARAVRTPADIARRRSFADEHSWERRVDQLALVLGLDKALPDRADGTRRSG